MKFILTADLHLRDDCPRNRKDDYWQAQWKKIAWLKKKLIEYDAPILDAGDLFHKAKPSLWLINNCIDKLPTVILMKTIPGNHDLPYHNHDLLEKSGLETLNKSNSIEILKEGYTDYAECGVYAQWYESKIKINNVKLNEKNILIHHGMIWNKKKPFPGCEGFEAEDFINENPGFDLILTGHNHQSFTAFHNDTWLVNPGSMMRMSIDQRDFKPRIFIYDTETKKIDFEYFPIEADVWKEGIDEAKEKNKKIEKFVESLYNNYESGVSFEKNLELFFEKNKTSDEIKNLVWEVVK